MKSHYYCIEQAYTASECQDLYDAVVENANPQAKPVGAQNVTKTSEVKLCDYGAVIKQMNKARNIVHDINKNFFGFNLFSASDFDFVNFCLLYTSPSPRDRQKSRMPSSA